MPISGTFAKMSVSRQKNRVASDLISDKTHTSIALPDNNICSAVAGYKSGFVGEEISG